jgi:hypothetical protein
MPSLYCLWAIFDVVLGLLLKNERYFANEKNVKVMLGCLAVGKTMTGMWKYMITNSRTCRRIWLKKCKSDSMMLLGPVQDRLVVCVWPKAGLRSGGLWKRWTANSDLKEIWTPSSCLSEFFLPMPRKWTTDFASCSVGASKSSARRAKPTVSTTIGRYRHIRGTHAS